MRRSFWEICIFYLMWLNLAIASDETMGSSWLLVSVRLGVSEGGRDREELKGDVSG